MTFTSKHLILRSKPNSFTPTQTVESSVTPFTLSAYNLNTGRLVNRKKTKCQHVLPYGSFTVIRAPYDSLTAVGVQNGSTEDILTEGCLHPECEVIRGYDITSGGAFIVFENVKPHAMCAGPTGNLLVCDRKTNKLIQLTYIIKDFLYDMFQQNPLPFSILADSVKDMCYSPDNQLLALAHSKIQSITLLKMSTGEVIGQIEIPSDLGLFNRHLCSGPFGTIFVANGRNFLQYDGSQRLIAKTKYSNGISGIAASFPDNDSECKLAIRYTTPDNRVRVDIAVPIVERKIFVPIEPVEIDMTDI